MIVRLLIHLQVRCTHFDKQVYMVMPEFLLRLMAFQGIAFFVGEMGAHVIESSSLLYKDVQVRLLPQYSFWIIIGLS